MFESNLVENRTNGYILELNFAEKLRSKLNIDKNYSEIFQIIYVKVTIFILNLVIYWIESKLITLSWIIYWIESQLIISD